MKHLNSFRDAVRGLFPSGKIDASFKLFAIFDAARSEALHRKIMELARRRHCLFKKAEARGLDTVGPWLTALSLEDPLLEWALERGFGKSWGIFLLSKADFKTLGVHYMKLTGIRDAAGKSYLSRYYDPRVLRVFFPACSPGQQNYLLSPARNFILENSEKNGWITFGKVPGAPRITPVFDKKQEKAFGQHLTREFEERMLKEIEAEFPEKFKRPAGKSKVHYLICQGIKKAAGHNIKKDRNVAAYIRLMFKLQPDFELMEGMEPVLEILKETSLSETARISMATELTKETKWLEKRPKAARKTPSL